MIGIAGPLGLESTRLFLLAGAVVGALACAAVLWQLRPAYAFAFAIFLSPLSHNWQQLGIPGAFALDRLVLVFGILAVLLRAPAIRARPALAIEPVHAVMAISVAYVIVSALAAHTLFHSDAFFGLLESYGVLPFLTFWVARSAFSTTAERNLLLAALVLLGLYLGATALCEALHVNALVFPKYILNPNYGDPATANRARGPFADAVQNGVALYACGAASVLAAVEWRRPTGRAIAGVSTLLCLAGAFVTLQRSVWLGAVVATLLVMLVTPGLRRWLLPTVGAMTAVVVMALALIPGLAANAQSRATDALPVWDRQNLLVAGVAMVEARPLFGFGWTRFQTNSANYFKQGATYPLTGTTTVVHNVFLSYGVDLGLLGLTLWVVCLILGVGGALAARGPPELRRWRVLLLAVATMALVVDAFVPPSVFPTLIMWLLAGIVWPTTRPEPLRPSIPYIG